MAILSVFIFGSDNLLSRLPKWLHDPSVSNIITIDDLKEAITHIQNRPPDVILVQASLDGSLKLCRWLQEPRLSTTIFCILLEDRPHVFACASQNSTHRDLEVPPDVLQQRANAYILMPSGNETQQIAPDISSLDNQLDVALRTGHKYHDLIRTNERLRRLAFVDALTKFGNRRALKCELPKQTKNACQTASPLSLIMLEIDNFKPINKTYGHLVGDRLLELLCDRLRKNLRIQDTPFRYGGDEFAIISNNTTYNEALIMAHCLNRSIGEQPFLIDNLSIKVTVSLGVACWQPEDDVKGKSLLKRADQCMLQAQASGGNLVRGSENQLSESLDIRATCY